MSHKLNKFSTKSNEYSVTYYKTTSILNKKIYPRHMKGRHAELNYKQFPLMIKTGGN